MRSKIFKAYCAIMSLLCGIAGLFVASSSDAALHGLARLDPSVVFLEALSVFFVVALSVVRTPAGER